MGKGRAPCCDKSQVKRGPWSPAEDLRLVSFIQKHGHENWRSLPKQAGLLRCGKSCRLRWINYLRPDVKRGNFTKEEEDAIIKLHEKLGNKWSKIASYFPGRTDNEIKNVWNTHLKKRLQAPKTDHLQIIPDPSPDILQLKEPLTGSPTVSNLTNESNNNPSPNNDEFDSMVFNFTGSSNHGADKTEEEFQIPMDSDLEFWNMLDNVGPFEYDYKGDDLINEEPKAHQKVSDNGNGNVGQAAGGDHQRNIWLKYLENELGLAESSDDLHHQTMNQTTGAQTNCNGDEKMMMATFEDEEEVNVEVILDDNPNIWASPPHRFNI